MKLEKKLFGWCLAVIVCSASLVGCGGGGSSDGSDGSPTQTAAPSGYVGNVDQAALSDDNAEAVALNAYEGQESIPVPQMSSTAASTDDALKSFPMGLLRTLKGALAEAGIHGPVARPSVYIPSTVIQGACGENCGQMSFDMDFNETTGEIKGTMYLSEYRNSLSEDPASGTVFYSGIFNPSNGTMNILMDFEDYEIHGTYFQDLIGSMSMATATDGTVTLEMNVTVDDGVKTYSWGDFISVVKMVDEHWEVTLTGRFYDFDYGYVDITTPNPILEDLDYNVYAGQVRFVGQDNSWATLTFSPDGYDVATSAP